jgi:elongation factor G
VQSIIERLGAPAVLYLPIGSRRLQGLVDLVENRAIIWKEESLGAVRISGNPGRPEGEAAEYRAS